MTDSRYYPTISEQALLPFKVVRDLLAQDPDFLSDPDCPYSQAVKEFFLGTMTLPEGGSGDRWVDLEAETGHLYQSLKAFGSALDTRDAAEKMAYFRAATTLLEKLTTLKERAHGLRRLHEFQTTVMDVIDSVLTPDQRTDVMEKIKASIA